ncbi:hypothetical protein SAMN02745823_03886 [Sporobacter termitidis DSM 10068]|uniref:Uncharacterized protein n=1 Tax=Sporobacter termitidis DSM 10068 TaxID=1123282 RepID=A0A1M5ZLC4_9FIRM|nr:hypothetical protein [Sporobacter termitidis]SHI24961.1 hypothetical protein SAMN02745823_03886 [Sporobacter termitidis DSM 10068]
MAEGFYLILILKSILQMYTIGVFWHLKLIEIEPAVLEIYNMSIGTELTLIQEGKRKFFIDTNTGKEITLYK